ncbi:MAG: right-handed parallel beta-helix repeat-containing protein [Lachnospiraceae bacterium]
MIFHVSKVGRDYNEGSEVSPFLTISKAAKVAMPGDEVCVHEGVYREWVKPSLGGLSELRRITYSAVEGEKVIIKGSEVVKGWEVYEGSVWKVVLPNAMFGEYNPYEQTIDGDWMVSPKGWRVHAGDVYLNGKSFFEARTLEDVKEAKAREEFTCLGRTFAEEAMEVEDTTYQWYAEVLEDETILYANFQDKDPNKQEVEINVRKCCFYPEKFGINYITVRGFEMAQAATHWAPPTGDQVGMLGANWSKGWIIEDNVFHDAKCSAVSIGKEGSTGTQDSFRTKQKSGYEYQLEAVFRGLQIGWNKEKVGSHIVRNNVMYDCGQNGIVGHMGCAYSKIYGNHIYNIGVKHEFFGWEIAGIKFHAPIDVEIYENRIHNCIFGFWMDWQAQGTRISRNLLYKNLTDGNIEVTHGPCIVDNNIFASLYGFDNHAQGTAFINNIICGRTHKVKILDRATPYHVPHSTTVAGFAYVYCGDDRYFNNLFVGDGKYVHEKAFYGTSGYNCNAPSYEAYVGQHDLSDGMDHERYGQIEQPVYINDNVYLNGAEAYKLEAHNHIDDTYNPQLTIIEEMDGVYLEMNLPEEAVGLKGSIASTQSLGTIRIVDTIYDAPDGSMLTFDVDYFKAMRADESHVGPFSNLVVGKNRIKVWG